MTDFQRSSQDTGNIVSLEHVNLKIPDQETAMTFYLSALGLTRDPYKMVGSTNMWINIGRQQFHLPKGDAQQFIGTICITVPDRTALLHRLELASASLSGTHYQFSVNDSDVDIVCPWGNQFKAIEAQPGQRDKLKITELQVPVALGAAESIVAFYQDGLGARAKSVQNTHHERVGCQSAVVTVGAGQTMVFYETDDPLPEYDGHHVAIYLANFSQPHEWLQRQTLVTREDSEYQYRFCDIKPLANEPSLLSLEHEVRSLHHPLFNRRLVNRLDIEG